MKQLTGVFLVGAALLTNIILSGCEENGASFNHPNGGTTPGNAKWVFNHSGLNATGGSASALNADSSGNIYFAFMTDTNAENPGTSPFPLMDGALVKYNPSTNTQAWVKAITGTGGSLVGVIVQGVVQTSTGVYVSGYTDKDLGFDDALPVQGVIDAFLIKYDSDGNKLWSKHWGSALQSTTAYGLAADGSGNIYVGGSADWNVSGVGLNGSVDAYIRKFDPSGAVTWTAQYGEADIADGAAGIGPDGISDIITQELATGIAVSSDGNSVYISITDVNLQQPASGVPAIMPLSTQASIRKINGSAAPYAQLWRSTVEGTPATPTFASSIVLDEANSSIYIAGDTAGQIGTSGAGTSTGIIDAYVAKYTDGVGAPTSVFQRGAAGTICHNTYGLNISADGNTIAAITNATGYIGTTAGGAMNGLHDAVVFHLNSSLTPNWVNHFGVSGYMTYGLGAILDSSGNVSFTGYSSGNPFTLSGPSTGTNDFFLAQYTSAGVLVTE